MIRNAPTLVNLTSNFFVLCMCRYDFVTFKSLQDETILFREDKLKRKDIFMFSSVFSMILVGIGSNKQ